LGGSSKSGLYREIERLGEGEWEVSGGSATAGEEVDVGGSRTAPATLKMGFFSGVFPKPKQWGFNFWVSRFSGFDFQLMGTEFLGRNSLREAVEEWENFLGSWGFQVNKNFGVIWEENRMGFG
jgi:hypothetical protein